jgi:DNA-binding MarR family transcriptional regulator
MRRFRYSVRGFTVDRSIGYLLLRTHKLVRQRVEKLFDDRGLTLSQWIALTLIGERVATTPSEIARKLGHTTGATTRLVDQLEIHGLVERSREAVDRRVVELALKPGGRKAVAAIVPMVTDTWNELLEDFDSDEIETLISLLTRLLARLEKDENEPVRHKH